MILDKITLGRSPWKNNITTQRVPSKYLYNLLGDSQNLYELIPKKFCEFTLILHKLYNIDKTLNSVGDFIKKDKEDINYFDYKKQLFNQTLNPYNKFPQIIVDAWGKPNLPKEYVELFGEFYNYKCLTTYLWCKEINRVKPYYDIKFYVSLINKEYRVFFISKDAGLFEEINYYWNVEKHTTTTFLTQLLEENK